MDDLTALNDVTAPAVLSSLEERFHRRIFHTYLGDFLLSINPCHVTTPNESEVGRWFLKSKPLQELPPHVMTEAHRIHRALLADFQSHSVIISGRTGSGKSTAGKTLTAQLLREARLSPSAGLGPLIVMAMHVQDLMVGARTTENSVSTRALKTFTLHFRPDGQLAIGEVRAMCVENWRLLERPVGHGNFNVFYAMMAGLGDRDLPKYYLIERYRIIERNDGSSIFVSADDHRHNLEMFNFLMTALVAVGLDVKFRNTHGGEEVFAFLAILSTILHLGNLQMTAHAQTGQLGFVNHHELRAAADMLCVPQKNFESLLLSTSTVVQGQLVQVPCSLEQAIWFKDVILVELYKRLLTLVIDRFNTALISQQHQSQPCPLASVTTVEVPSLDLKSGSGLEIFLRNMAHERIQTYLNDVIFRRDVEQCEREQVAPYKVKFADNRALVDAVFKPETGIMAAILMQISRSDGSPSSLVSSLNKDKALKKSEFYVKCKQSGVSAFTINHFAGQVTYNAHDFISKNRSVMPQALKELLMRSLNPLAVTLAMDAIRPNPGQPPASPIQSVPAWSYQNEMASLIQRVNAGNLHHILCVRPNTAYIPGNFDRAEVTSQVKEANVVETIRQRKLGYSACLPHHEFIKSFRSLLYKPSTPITSFPEACKAILAKADLLGRGAHLTRTSVFLRYWHMLKLYALKANELRKIVLVQSLVRGFLLRRRLGGRMTAEQQFVAIGQFCDHVARTGSRTWGVVQDEAELDKRRFESEMQSKRQHYFKHHDDRNPLDRQISSLDFVPENKEQLDANVVGRVLASLSDLDSSTWAKVIYIEKERQLAKVYLDTRAVIIDGSHAVFDGDRFGLGGVRNQYRDEETSRIHARIQEGLRLKKDSDGSILACRLSDQPIFVKGLNDLSKGCLPADVIECMGELPLDKMIKIFDIKEFQSKIALEIKNARFSKVALQRACLIGLSFGRDDRNDLQTPCWLCVVSVTSLSALESQDLVRDVQLRITQMELTTADTLEERTIEREAKQRHERDRWAKTDQREHLKQHEGAGRHVRHQLRAKGLPVGEQVGYSWEGTGGGDKKTTEAIKKLMNRETPSNHGRTDGPEKGRNWAKMATAIKVLKNMEELKKPEDKRAEQNKI